MSTSKSKLYNKEFYTWQSVGSYSSAQVVVPFINELFNITSVIDVGCGVGTWLKVFNEIGVNNVVGLDGEWVDKEKILIDEEFFHRVDFTKKNVSDNRKFDLSMSLEVAEHLPEDLAENFVKLLCEKSSIVMFSAATPNQGGTEHINEQWQSYWAEIFIEQSYYPFDIIRPFIFGNEQVEWWYQQNIMLYINDDYKVDEHIMKYRKSPKQLDYACRTLCDDISRKAFQPKLRELISKVPAAFVRDFKRKTTKLF